MTEPQFRPIEGDPAAEAVESMFDARSEDWVMPAAGDYQTAAVETMREDGTGHQRVVALEWPGRRNHTDEKVTVRLMIGPEDAIGLAEVLDHTGRWLANAGREPPAAHPAPDDPRFLAMVDFVPRTGAAQFQLRWSDDEKPTLWMAVALYDAERWETAAGATPYRAVGRLLEQLVDGGMCQHCRRPTAFDPDRDEAPFGEDLLCWYRYDAATQKIVRGCA